MRALFYPFLFVALWLASTVNPAAATPRFELRDGDRVAFLGDTFMEREPAYGEIELALTTAYPDIQVFFRNLGWSADTVLGESRAGFDPPAKGFDRLKEHLRAVKPSVVFLSHGMASSFGGSAALPAFKSDMEKLLAAIRDISPEARFVILGPIRHENLGAPLPDPARHNEDLKLYNAALREIANQNQFPFVPLFELLPDGGPKPARPLTDNGIHLNAYGYRLAARAICKELGVPAASWRVTVPARGAIAAEGAQASRKNGEALAVKPLRLPSSPMKGESAAPMLTFSGLSSGWHSLKADGKLVATHSAQEWKNGQPLGGAIFDQVEELRRTIQKKNQLYFYRWRPQNETYLFGFRKYEQGQNAREIPMFDPLVSAEEAKIAELKKPKEILFSLEKSAKPAGEAPASRQDRSTKLNPPAHPQQLPEFEVAPGFEVSLWAESPQLAKPIELNFDPRGRLWVASSSVYPQIQPGQVADDKILILEDTNGDGKADKSTIFADGLLIPTGVEPGDGGAYVGQSTELLYFKDTDGDGKADERRTVLSGFGTEDTHHIVHTLRWGHDGQLYFNQSIYIHTHMETPHGIVRLNSGGILALRPETLEVGIHMRGLVNGWGHHFDRFGQSFATDGAGGDGINYVIPGAMYVTYAGARRILGSVSPGSYPKFCSLEVIESKQFPDDWQGNMITCDFRAHRVVRFSIEEQGSGYITKEMPDLLRTTNVTFRPIDVKLGPDGALYIADWSNPIIQHGEVDFRDPRRDHENGRIWRVTAKGRPLNKRQDFAAMSNSQLLAQLLSENGYDRQRARRVLTEKREGIVSDLASWTAAQTDEMALLQALWMHQSVNVVNAPLLKKLLSAKDGRIRAAATRVLSHWHDRVNEPLRLLAKMAADEHPRARLEAARALAKISSSASADLVLSILDRPMDKFLDYAVWLSINDLAAPWLDAVQNGSWKIEGREKQLEFGLRAVEPRLASAVLSRLWEENKIPRDGSGPWIELIGKAGSPGELRQIFSQATSGKFDSGATARTLAALAEAARARNLRPNSDLQALLPFLESADQKIQALAVELAGLWKLSSFSSRLLSLAGSPAAAAPLRSAAFQSLRAIGGGQNIEPLKKLAAPENPLPVRQQAVQTLVFLRPQDASIAAAAIAALTDTKEEQEALALWRGLLGAKGAATTLAHALPKTGLPPAMARAGLRVAREGGRKEPELVLALARNVESDDEAKNLNASELQQLASNAIQTGNAERGERIYRRAELGCTTCHAIGGVGGKVGPDMTSIGASAPVDYLVESVLFPNRKIKEGFHALLIETKDGEEVSGVLVSETPDQLMLRDVTGRELAVAKPNIQKKSLAGSLMPSGLVDALSPQDQADLYRFLSELGKPGPFDASKASAARSWKLYAASIDIAQFGDERVLREGIAGKEWMPAATLVDGRLLKSQFEERLATSSSRNSTELYAAAQLEIPKAGPVTLELENLSAAPLWVDGRAVTPQARIELQMPAGRHLLVVKLDGKKLPEYIRIKSKDGSFLIP